MIVQINNSINYGCTMDTLKLMSHNTYPEQDIEKINKIILLRYKEEGIINNRFFIDKNKYPEYTGNNDGYPTFFLILRYDKVEPYRVILMSTLGRIIVTDKKQIESLSYQPNYISKFTNSSHVSNFNDRDELFFASASTYEEFLKLYQDEFIHQYKIQDEVILGSRCYTEYYQDIMKTNASTNILDPTREKTFNEIKEELLKEDPNKYVFPDEILKSFPIYYNRRGQSNVDKPLRVINTGTIIRADCNSDGELVVAENYNNKLRFITGKEAFVYTDYIKKRDRYFEQNNLSLIEEKIFTGEE